MEKLLWLQRSRQPQTFVSIDSLRHLPMAEMVLVPHSQLLNKSAGFLT